MRLFSLIALAALAWGGCSAVNKRLGLKDDHFIEDHLEDVLEDQLGLPEDSVDFTP